jgi:hypothetical protein
VNGKRRFRTAAAYAFAHVFELWLGIAAILSSVTFFVSPESRERSSVGMALSPYDLLWTVGYGSGGLLIVYGLFRTRPRFEAAGLSLIAAASALQAIAVLVVRGLPGTAAAAVLLAVAVACAIRVVTVVYVSGHHR